MSTTQAERALPGSSGRGSTRALRIGVWVSTGLFAAMFGFSGVMFIAGPPEVVTQLHHLGYPDYFRALLGVAKLLGVAALVFPLPSPTPREWAYAGLTFVCISAFASHLMSGDPAGKAAPPLFALALLLVSYFLRRLATSIARAGT